MPICVSIMGRDIGRGVGLVVEFPRASDFYFEGDDLVLRFSDGADFVQLIKSFWRGELWPDDGGSERRCG